MTPRTGLAVTLVGFALTVLCAVPFFLLRNLDQGRDDVILGMVVLFLGASLGVTILVVGLIVVAITAVRKQHPQRACPRDFE